MAISKAIVEDDIELDEDEFNIEGELELELVIPDNPEIIELEDGSIEIVLSGGDEDELSNLPFNSNLADYLEDDDLAELASDIIEGVDNDIASRSDWLDSYIKGLDVLGFQYEEKTTPWAGACGVHSSILSEAAIGFQAETMFETFPSKGPVKAKIIGEETREALEAAKRVQADMNHELTDVMTEYRHEHERMLYSLGLAGSAFKKIYYDPSLNRQVAIYLASEDVIVPYGASNIESAERVTHIMRKTKNEIKKLQVANFYVDEDLGEPEVFHSDIDKYKAEQGGYELTEDDRYCLFEVHADLIIDALPDSEDGVARPYVVTIERGSTKILGLRRNWSEDDPMSLKRQHFVHYIYVPGFGFYGLGLIHIIGNYARAGTSIIRQLVDAGTLSNLPGGLKSRGLRIKGDKEPIEPGEFKDVDVPSGSIRDNIMTLPYKEPSQVLLALLHEINNDGRKLGMVSDMDVSDMSANAPVGTTLAILERTLKPMTAVQARVHYTMKQEFRLLKQIIEDHTEGSYTYTPYKGENYDKAADYAMVKIIPVSDPNTSTMAQRVVQYQAVHQLSATAPQIYNLPELHRQMIEVLGVPNADKLVPIDDDIKPKDPISENMAILVGKPVKAFIIQDHKAHIATHTAMMQDPKIMQIMGQNPQAQQLMGSLHAHIVEHVAFDYRSEMEAKLGATLPPPDTEINPELEILLSRLAADAGSQLTELHKKEAAQQEAQQQQQDPLIQMQQQELMIKGKDLERKAKLDQANSMLKGKDLERKAKLDQANSILKGKELEHKIKKEMASTMLDAKGLELDSKKQGIDAGLAKSRTVLDIVKEMKNKDVETQEKSPKEN